MMPAIAGQHHRSALNHVRPPLPWLLHVLHHAGASTPKRVIARLHDHMRPGGRPVIVGKHDGQPARKQGWDDLCSYHHTGTPRSRWQPSSMEAHQS